jgi:hypothetical protein
MRPKAIIAAALVLFCSAIASAQRPTVKLKLDILGQGGSFCETRAAIVALHEMGTEALPALIARINDQSKSVTPTMLQNPLSSQIAPEQLHEGYQGVLYAYVVELILGRTHLSKNYSHCGFLLGNDEEYLCKYGVIRKRDGAIQPGDAPAQTRPDLKETKPVDASDLEQIRSTYLAWWALNANRPLEQLRADWQAGTRPLGGSKYQWL